MKRTFLSLAAAISLSALPSAASADVLLTPFAGATFATEDFRKPNFGVSLALGGIIGFEVDLSQTRLGSFDEIPLVSLEADATTLMGNLMLRIPTGPVQPYGSAGVGLIRIKGSVDVPFVGNLVSAEAQDLGINVGGGLYLFPSRNIGIRGDVRYFRTLGDLTLDDVTDIRGLDDLPLPRVDFWRVTGGVTIRF